MLTIYKQVLSRVFEFKLASSESFGVFDVRCTYVRSQPLQYFQAS